MQTPMKRYPDQFTRWNPGYVQFTTDTADVDTIKRLSPQKHLSVDMRQHMKFRAASIADSYLAASMQKNT